MSNRPPRRPGFSFGQPQIDQISNVRNRLGFGFGAPQPTFGEGRPPIDDGFNRGGVQRAMPPVRPTPRTGMDRSPWDIPEDTWEASMGDLEIDRGMGRIGGSRPTGQYGAEGISAPGGRRSNDPAYWQGRISDLRGQTNFVDPTQDWGDDDWMDVYEPGDAVNVKADGNPNFGKAYDGDSWEDVDPTDPSVASMFAESAGWEDDYQSGIKEAWANNDEQGFQRWRNLARAYETSKWQNAQPQAVAPDPGYSVPRNPGKRPAPPKAPAVPTTPVAQPDPWRKKQSPIY